MAQSAVQVSTDGICALRKCPGALGDVAFPSSLLRHADEQTVVGLAAVLNAVRSADLDPNRFADWGVVAAPRFFGRNAFDRAFPQFLAEGAWGVSPHLVPSHSLHSPSGLISQALKAHGPNLGVGGAPGSEHDAFLTAASFLAEGTAAGVWIVLTGWNPEWAGGDCEQEPPLCAGLALAVVSARSAGGAGTRIRLRPEGVFLELSPRNRGRAATGSIRIADWFAAASAQPGLDEQKLWRIDRSHPRSAEPHQQSTTIRARTETGAATEG